MTKKGKKCLVIEKRNHIGGNIYTQLKENINIHKYGAHIFHTNNKEIGNTLTNLQTSTDTPIHLLPITKENYTTYHLT